VRSPVTAAGTAVPAEEHTLLRDGWEAAGVAPGSADHRLDGVALAPVTVPCTAASAGSAEAGRDFDAEDWWFRCSFPRPPEADETALVCEGIATLADVWLNGEHLLSADDMHAPHEAPVGGLLGDENTLVVGIRALGPVLAERRPRPRWRTRLVRDQGLRFVRTALFGRIPSFAPGPAPVGLWRPVSLVARRGVAADELRVRTHVDGTAGRVDVRARLRPLAGGRVERVSAHVDGPGGSVEAPLDLLEAHGGILATGVVEVRDVARWWPHTHGDQPRYQVTLTATGSFGDVAVDAGTVGFRSLWNEDAEGLSLVVNDTPVFCRGGALLPDLRTIDHDEGRLRGILERCRAGGMNTIRLSGVGTYGDDTLYALCDELGLLVWQDFPFASLDYPGDDPAFRVAVSAEAAAFLSRAGTHPSLAVLCGNSEVEQQAAMLGLDPDLGRGELFGELLPALVAEHAVDAVYVPSSPSGGSLPFRPNAGVAHYFGVGAYTRPLEDARRADVRFASECLAFANVPSDDVLDDLAPDGAGRLTHHPAWKAGVPRDTGTGWDFDDVRDHYLRLLFGADPVALRWADPERYLALSRITTGEVMAETVGEWRRAASACRGALLWTLNDALPGAGWGVLDHRGQPKAAYWLLRRVLQPVAVWTTDEGTNGLAVHAANDTGTALDLTLRVALARHDGVVVDGAEAPVRLPPRTTIALDAETVLGRFADAGDAFRFGPASHDALVAELVTDGTVRSRTVRFVHGPPTGQVPVADIGVTAEGRMRPDGSADVVVRSRRIAYAVAVEAPGAVPGDDVFTVVPGSSHAFELRPVEGGGPVASARLRPLNGVGSVPVSFVDA
jgi:beta-mannosidase